ncbi:MAG: hypothetical protein K2M43_01025 [Mycoplasmoidaceae bacterium]|nr:hypothetical protein [Mycoplasmoidaceae bacterium]
MKIKKYIPLAIAALCLPTVTACSGNQLTNFIKKLKSSDSIVQPVEVQYANGTGTYKVYPFSEEIKQDYIRRTQDGLQLQNLLDYFTNNILKVNFVYSEGSLYIGAANPSTEGTNYDAV